MRKLMILGVMLFLLVRQHLHRRDYFVAWGDGFVGVPANVPRCEGWIHSVREEPWRSAQ